MEQEGFSVEQIVEVLKQAKVGVPMAELIRKVGISGQTSCPWKEQYTGLEVDQPRRLIARYSPTMPSLVFFWGRSTLPDNWQRSPR